LTNLVAFFQVSLEKQIKQEKENEKALYSRMFGGTSEAPKSKKMLVSKETYKEMVIVMFYSSLDQIPSCKVLVVYCSRYAL
jgi:hypothetical protein